MTDKRILAISLIFASLSALGQTPAGTTTTYYPAKTLPGVAPPAQMMAMPSIAPLFIQDGRFSSSLMLVNNASMEAGATVTLRNIDGGQIAQRHIVLGGGSQREISLTELLSNASEYASVGSLSVLQDAGLQGATINAQLLLMDRGNLIPAYIDEELAMPSMEGSSKLRGVTDSAAGPALLAINNLADMPQTVTVQCLIQKSASANTKLVIPAHGTSLTPACTNKVVGGVDGYIQGLPNKEDATVSGIEITGDGGAGMLAAFAFAPHRRRDEVIFSAVPFTDPQMQRSSTMIYAGVPFGIQTVVSDGIYTPHISLSNYSVKPANIKITLADSSSRLERDGALVADFLPQPHILNLTLKGGESTEVVLDSATTQSGLLHSIEVESDQPAGQVQSKVVSRGSGSLYQVELLGKDSKDQENAGGHPWSIAGDDESHLLLFDSSMVPTSFVVHIAVPNGAWEKRYQIAPGETREISINRIVHEAIKDDTGRILAANLQKGVVYWSAVDPGHGTGRLLVSSKSAVSARNFSCGYTYVVCGANVSVFNYGIVPIFGYTDYSNVAPQYCLAWGPGACSNLTQTDSSGGVSYTWSLGDATIVNFNTPSDQYSASPNLVGNSVGSTYANFQAQENGCGVSGGGNPPPATCGASISPGSFSATCDGSKQTGNFVANLLPSASACVYNGDKSSCTASNNNNGTISGVSYTCNMNLAPAGTVTYFVGSVGGGGSGNQGSIHLTFSLNVGGNITLPVSSDASVICP